MFLDFHFNYAFGVYLAIETITSFFCDLDGDYCEALNSKRCGIPRAQHTREGAHSGLSSLSGNPIPKKTSSLSQAPPEPRSLSRRSQKKGVKPHLIPRVVEHNRTADRDSGLVAHKMVKCAIMITSPTLEEGTCLEEHLGELFQG